MQLELLDAVLAIARLDASEPIPAWAGGSEFFSVTRTAGELSIVCDAAAVSENTQCQPGWRCLKVDGPLDFSMVGVLSSLANPLAQANVPIFVISTFDTDYILIAQANLERAIHTLEQEGHVVHTRRATMKS